MGKGTLVNSDNMQWLNKQPLKEWKEFPKFRKHGNFWKPQKHVNSSRNLGSAGMFWKPRNASASSETLECHLVGILTLDRYLKELASIQNLIEEATASKNSTPSASLSLLTKEEETIFTHTEVWWTGSNHGASLACDHLRYHETCFQCRKLSHTCINCHLYQCPTCLKTSPSHIQAHCPLKHHIPFKQTSSSSSSDGGPSHHSQCSSCMITTKPRLTSCISSAHHSHSSSPTYINDGVTNEAWDNLNNEPAYNTYEIWGILVTVSDLVEG